MDEKEMNFSEINNAILKYLSPDYWEIGSGIVSYLNRKFKMNLKDARGIKGNLNYLLKLEKIEEQKRGQTYIYRKIAEKAEDYIDY